MSKILIVEDEPMIAMMLGELLKSRGHTIEAVYNCIAARAEMHNDYDLAIFDLGLPNGDGTAGDGKELAKEFRAAGFTKPIIAFSGRFANEMEKPCLEAGMNAYVMKGDNMIVLAKVEELLGEHAAA